MTVVVPMTTDSDKLHLPSRRLTSVAALQRYRERARARPEAHKTVRVCMDTGCRVGGGESIMRAFERELEHHGLRGSVAVRATGCHGFCARGPVVAVDPEGLFYQMVEPGDVPDIVAQTIVRGEVVSRLTYYGADGCPCLRAPDIPFFSGQKRVVLRNCGTIDATDIDAYIAQGGYEALARALEALSPADVVETVKASGLRGRGGGGFPTGRKWELAAAQQSDKKYVICNADEGDPGAFMDRGLLEGDTHAVVEGMLIGAYAMGADEGYVYCRAEYPGAIRHLRIALAQAEERGLLGECILGSDFSFRLHIKEGAGAFVCGEETALIASIEGRRGMPRARPPYPAVAGLWGKPTNINNVETWANVPLIIVNGAEWYRTMGTENSPGTKVFSLAGKLNNTGLVEVPMGMSLREIVYDIGGGIVDGRPFKAVQTGGPSGGCIPAEFLDIPVSYESLIELGSFMGSGGLIVMDDTSCMVDVAKYFQDFCRDESCGKCVPCRVGTTQLWMLLDLITRGEATMDDLAQLERLAGIIQKTSLCGLGQGAPNPIFSTLRYFRDEYLAHIVDRVCPAGVCAIEPAEVMA